MLKKYSFFLLAIVMPGLLIISTFFYKSNVARGSLTPGQTVKITISAVNFSGFGISPNCGYRYDYSLSVQPQTILYTVGDPNPIFYANMSINVTPGGGGGPLCPVPSPDYIIGGLGLLSGGAGFNDPTNTVSFTFTGQGASFNNSSAPSQLPLPSSYGYTYTDTINGFNTWYVVPQNLGTDVVTFTGGFSLAQVCRSFQFSSVTYPCMSDGAPINFPQNFTVTVEPFPGPDFNLSCDTNSVTVQQGQSANYSVRATSQNGFSGQVTVDATGGKHSTMTSTPAVLNVPAGGFANSPPVTVTTQLSTPPGTYNLTFTGSSPGYASKTCPATLVVQAVPGPAVDIVASPNPVNVNPANNIATTNLSWLVSNSTSCNKTSSPANASWGSSSAPVAITPANGGPVPVDLTVNTTFTITCSNGSTTVYDSETVVVNPNPAFTVTPATIPAYSFTGVQNNNATISPGAQNFTVTNTGNVPLTISVTTDQVWLTLGSSSFTLNPSISTTVSVVPNSTATSIPIPATANVTFADVSPSPVRAPSLARQVRYTLSPPPGFAMNCVNINPSTSTNQTVTRGSTASWSVPVVGSNGFNQVVSLALSNQPANSGPAVTPSLSFIGSPNPENRSSSVSLPTGATTQTGTFNMTLTASSPGYPAQTCTLPLAVDAYEFTVTSITPFSAQQGDPVPAAKYFLITNNGTIQLTFKVSKSVGSTWFKLNDQLPLTTTINNIVVPPNGGTASIKVQPNDTSTVGSFSDINVVFDSQSSAGSQTKSVDYTVSPLPPPVVTVTAECGNNIGAWTDPVSYTSGPNPTCSLASSGASGYIRWQSSPSTNTCSVTPLTGDSMQSNNPVANPPGPVVTNGLNNPPATHQFRVRCSPDGGVTYKDDIATFNVPVGGTYNLNQSAKHAIAVNQPNLSDSALQTANVNPCDGLGHVVDSLKTYNFKEGDIVTFAINICNTGSGDLVFPGSGTNGYVIKLNDVLGNLGKPSSGWNESVSCGLDCQMSPADDSQAGKLIFNIDIKSGGNNRLVGSGHLWTVFFNAVIKSPVPATQTYYYFNNCVADSGGNAAMTVKNLIGLDIYHNPNTSGGYDIPGFCLQALFSRGSNAPDRQEIAP